MKIVVIGAGVIGSSIALQLKRLGHDVTVVERNSGAGLGSTSASSAVVRFNYSTFDAVMLSWESYFHWKDFKDLIDNIIFLFVSRDQSFGHVIRAYLSYCKSNNSSLYES